MKYIEKSTWVSGTVHYETLEGDRDEIFEKAFKTFNDMYSIVKIELYTEDDKKVLTIERHK